MRSRLAGVETLGQAEEKLSEAERVFADLVHEGARQKASELHIDVVGESMHIRFRVDGRLRDGAQTWSSEVGHDVLHLAYLMSDESEGPILRAGVYQRGRVSGAHMKLPPAVCSMHLQFGDLPRGGKFMALCFAYTPPLIEHDETSLGYADFQVADLRTMRMRSVGLNCVVGPTGSGTSTTVQVVLQALARERKGSAMIMTLEDPPQYTILGARQLAVQGSVHDRSGAFSAAAGAMLRSGPDVIMIAEVYDKHTAQLAVRAAHTGHSVWTTMHAMRAASALTRLIEEGVLRERFRDPYLISGLVAQALVGKLCEKCAVGWEDAKNQQLLEPGLVQRIDTLFRDREQVLREHVRVRRHSHWCGDSGCNEGYLGRTVIAETVIPDAGYMEAYCNGLPCDAEDYWTASLGGVRIAEHGLAKMLAGQVDLADLSNVRVDDVETNRLDRVCELAGQLRL